MTAIVDLLLAHGSDGVFTLDQRLVITSWSRAMERMTSQPAGNAIGRSLPELFPSLGAHGEEDLLRSAIAGSTSRSSGDHSWHDPAAAGAYRATYVPLSPGCLGIVQDLAAIRATEGRLSESEARFRNMADVSPVMLWMARVDSLCTFFNQTWLDFTGRTLEEEWGVGWASGIHPQDFQPTMDGYEAAFARREAFELEYRLRRHDGEYRWLLDRGAPRYETDGRFAGFVGSCIDVTERRRGEDELRHAIGLRDDFIAVASHELRTPLTPVQLQLDAMELMLADGESELERRLRDRVAIARSRMGRASALVDRLLDASRLARGGKLELEVESFDLGELVERVVETARATTSTPIELVSDGTEIAGRWDRWVLEHIVSNLVSNAVKYGEGRPVVIRLSAVGEIARLAVEDQGIGIHPDDQARIFHRFERAVPVRHYAGFGLGLWIVERHVSALGGAVQVQSTPGKGSVFTVELPRALPDPPQ